MDDELKTKHRQQVEASIIRRFALTGIHEPRTGGIVDYDVCRKYDNMLAFEVNKIVNY